MSLNGLEAAEVIEAYQSALSEGGGWFLLKYNTRDEVALLQRGKGGVAEVQDVVHNYEEQSPLYGFIHYRRRKVVLKYVPEGTSRLLLARLAVHFEFIKEKFAPYDTIFTFAEAYELSDSTLSATCSLHTAASVKSLRDSPTRNLAGVKEEDVSESGTVRSPGSEAGTIRNSKLEEGTTDETRQNGASSPPTDGHSSPQSKLNGTSSSGKNHERTSSITAEGLRPRTASNTDKDLPPTPGFSSPYISEKPGSIYDHGDFTYRSSIDTRISSNSARPSTRDLNKAYDYNRPKIKVGPRPSIDSPMRPDAANGGENALRPVASLPSSVRLPPRKAVPRPNSQQSQKKFSLQIPKIPSQGSTPAPPPVTPVNASIPSDQIPPLPQKSPQNTAKASDAKSPKMTPEKRRLMKALEIRQKHLAAQHAAKIAANDEEQANQDTSKARGAIPDVNVIETSSEDTIQESPLQRLETEEVKGDVPQAEESKETPRDVQDSPISAPEPSDGPSTQASSITEEEIQPAQKQNGLDLKIGENNYKVSSGLEDILNEETQGPIVAVEQHPTRSSEATSKPTVIARPGDESIQEHIKEHSGDSSVEQVTSTPPDAPTQEPSSLRAEGELMRDSAKTISIISEASSVRTMTVKKVAPRKDPATPAGDPPVALSGKQAPQEALDSIESSTSIPHEETSKEVKEAFYEESSTADAEEPESPFLIESHSVQTSASPSVVNLLDGLSATTHNESTLPGHSIEAAAPAQAQQPSLFNMVGGFGTSEESIETPLSAVHEEPELASSLNLSATQALPNEPVHQQPKSMEPLSNGEINESTEPATLESAREPDQPDEQAQRSAAIPVDQVGENASSDSPASQKTRPRTTSKTFQFPSKSRSRSRGDKPPSLDLPREGTHAQGLSAIQTSQIHDVPVNRSGPDTMLKKQEVRSVAEPGPQAVKQAHPPLMQPEESEPEKRVDHSLAGPPVPDAIAHASSKALKLLGFEANQPDVPLDTRSETLANRNSSPEQETSRGMERTKPSEELLAPKPGLEAIARRQPGILVERQSGGHSDVEPHALPTKEGRSDTDNLSVSSKTKRAAGGGQTSIQVKRGGVVEPVKRVSTPEASEEHFLSDDSFMEELKSAKLQEAKPVSVSRSSIRPDYLRSETDPNAIERGGSRMVSNGTINKEGRRISISRPGTAVSLRSFSGTILPTPDVKTSPSPQSAQPKKFGVSSGISQRIKALETKSSRPNSPNLPTPTTPGFLNLRKQSFNSEVNGDQRRSRASTVYPSPQASPRIGQSEPLNRSPQLRGDTVSVTATIIRDPSDGSPRAPYESANPPILNLHESPLVVEHQVADPPKQHSMGPPQFTPLKPPRPRYSRYSSTKSVSSTSTEHKVDAASHSRRGSTTSMRSGKSSRDGSEIDLYGVTTDKSTNTSAPLDNIREEKRMSRSSRLLKRMSSVTSLSRRSIAQAISPSPKTASIIEREEIIDEKPTFSTINVGDINVQFPDTLLWKRRHMAITEGGIIMLSASKMDNNPKIVTKHYPLSGFRPPYIPDQDRQELPHSILLDFHDGSSLQCACEHPSAQAHLLKVLKTAHMEHQPQ